MRVKRAYVVVLILSLLIVDESSPFLLRPASANVLAIIPWGLRILFRTPNFRTISRALDKLRSFLRSNGGRRLRIGDLVDDISKIKDYFELFGYLNSTLNSDFTDEFTAELESAIENFQKTFHLNVTGQPDNATVSLIKLPRCAVPDVIKGSSTMLENRTTSFTKWWPEGKKELNYAFSPENETAASYKDVFADAFHRWSNVTKLKFSETTSFNDADIQIMFSTLDDELGVVGGVWLDNTTMKRRKIILDSDEEWVLPSEDMTENDELDLESTVMHQIGHVLGLNHSAIEEAIMYPYIVPTRKRKVDFAKDDLEMIQKLYSTK